MTEEDEREPPPTIVWLVRPKSDAGFTGVYRDEAAARDYVDTSASGAELAGPYVLRGARIACNACLLELHSDGTKYPDHTCGR